MPPQLIERWELELADNGDDEIDLNLIFKIPEPPSCIQRSRGERFQCEHYPKQSQL